MHSRLLSSLSVALIACWPAGASAHEYSKAIADHAAGIVQTWLTDKAIIDAVNAQNAAHAGLAQADIDKLDQQWRSEVSAASKPVIDKVMGNGLSTFLKSRQAANAGLYTEIFVMDNKGLNVGQSEITSDYWQGDEPKWQETFGKGPGSMHISEVEEDESTQTYQSQLSLPIVDPASGQAIGAITIGVNVEGL